MKNRHQALPSRALLFATLLCAALASPSAALARAGQIGTLGSQTPGAAPSERAPVLPGIEVCQDKTHRNCSRLQLPRAVGQVKSLLPINSIQNADLTLLVRGAKRTSLCYVASNWKGQRETVCKPVPHALPMARHGMSVTSVDGMRLFRFTRPPGIKAGPYDLQHARNFTVSLVGAERQLQKVANHRMAVSTAPGAPSTNLRASTVGTTSSMTAEGGECGWDDLGGNYCGAMGGGGGGGGGGGDGGWTGPDPVTNEIPAAEIPVPEWDPGYPGASDDPPLQLPERVPDDVLGSVSGEGWPTFSCVMTPDGPVCVATAPRPTPPVVGGIPGPNIDPETGGQLPPRAPSMCERFPSLCEPKTSDSGYNDEEARFEGVRRRLKMCWIRGLMDAGSCKISFIGNNDQRAYIDCLEAAVEKKNACEEEALRE